MQEELGCAYAHAAEWARIACNMHVRGVKRSFALGYFAKAKQSREAREGSQRGKRQEADGDACDETRQDILTEI